jgi:hypothetical protein
MRMVKLTPETVSTLPTERLQHTLSALISHFTVRMNVDSLPLPEATMGKSASMIVTELRARGAMLE